MTNPVLLLHGFATSAHRTWAEPGWLDIIGAGYAAERCDQLADSHGARFATPTLLREVAENGETFYDRFGPQQSKAA